MMDTFNELTRNHADRLKVLNEMQGEYAKMKAEMTHIGAFTKIGDVFIRGVTGHGTDQDQAAFRETWNAKIAEWGDMLTTKRTKIQDETKKEQTKLTNLQDTSNQLANMGSAMLQQLSSILAVIFK